MKKLKRTFLYLFFIVATFFCTVLFKMYVSSPTNFPAPYRLTIERGQTLFSISAELKNDNAIRSRRLFEIFMILLGNEKKVTDGEFYFEKPTSSLEIAIRISGRQFGIDKKRVTFPEGYTNKQMSERLGETFESFDSVLFLTLAKKSEGYLFPDTYGFFPSVTPDFIISTLKNNYEKKVDPLRQAIFDSGRTEREIIIMASIIEKEAKGESDRAKVSGILWKRLDQGIALQVDAPFLYILGKESKELTRSDLAINSPYNTYRFKGLPPTAIGNPGLDSIKAAIYPETSPYLYYLHDSDGQIYYASTYTQHKQNINKYLR